ncbi:MAG TPA: S8 family serine peptidase, partial [Actinomycetes bacterium]
MTARAATTVLPAWSWQFARGHLPDNAALPADQPLTRDWAWAGATGAGVRVAVIDSGVDGGHPAVGSVAGGVAISVDAATGRTELVEGPHEDLFGHGTACAGIIRRAAPECEIYSVRVLGARLSGRAAAFVAGLRWAVENGMHVANLSLSTGRASQFATFHRIADEAYFAGTV